MNFVPHVENMGFVQAHDQVLFTIYFQSYIRKLRKPHLSIFSLPHILILQVTFETKCQGLFTKILDASSNGRSLITSSPLCHD